MQLITGEITGLMPEKRFARVQKRCRGRSKMRLTEREIAMTPTAPYCAKVRWGVFEDKVEGAPGSTLVNTHSQPRTAGFVSATDLHALAHN